MGNMPSNVKQWDSEIKLYVILILYHSFVIAQRHTIYDAR